MEQKTSSLSECSTSFLLHIEQKKDWEFIDSPQIFDYLGSSLLFHRRFDPFVLELLGGFWFQVSTLSCIPCGLLVLRTL